MKTRKSSKRVFLKNVSIQGVCFIWILFLCVSIAIADSKKGLPDVSGTWELGSDNHYWKLTQSGTRVDGTFSSNSARGSLHGKLIGNRLVVDWECSWDNNPSDGLNSGQNECVLSEDGRKITGKIVKVKIGKPGGTFTLLRCPYTPPVDGLEGNWIVEYGDSDNIKGYTRIGGRSVWPVQNPDGTTTWHTSRCVGPNYGVACGSGTFTVTPEGDIRIKMGGSFMGNWGADSTSRQVGPNDILGGWTYADYGGSMIWRRVLPTIKEVSFHSNVQQTVPYGSEPGHVELTYNYTFESWVTARGARPAFNITLHGDHLWGRHHLWIDPALDLELQGSGFSNTGYPGPPVDKTILSRQIWVWSKATPGRKVLYFDGMPIVFDLIIHGHPKTPKEPELRFLVEKGSEFIPTPAEGIKYGEVFFVEAEFDLPPENKPVQVELGWEGDSALVELIHTDSKGLVYRSDPLRIIYENGIQLVVERQVRP